LLFNDLLLLRKMVCFFNVITFSSCVMVIPSKSSYSPFDFFGSWVRRYKFPKENVEKVGFTYTGYKTPRRLITLIPYCLLFLLIWFDFFVLTRFSACCLGGILFTIIFNESVKGVTRSVNSAVEDVVKLTDDGSNLIDNTFVSAQSILKKTNDTVSAVSSFTPFVSDVVGVINQLDPIVCFYFF
jgi:hypothetical protein